MEKAIIDRFTDNGQAVILVGQSEEERIVDINMLPEGAKEGSHVLTEKASGAIVAIQLDKDATEQAEKRVSDKMSKLREKKKMRRSR